MSPDPTMGEQPEGKERDERERRSRHGWSSSSLWRRVATGVGDDGGMGGWWRGMERRLRQGQERGGWWLQTMSDDPTRRKRSGRGGRGGVREEEG
ncbi:hypothetical protein Drorol1_Dr00020917 [Drosera rotundifolia]